MLVAHETHNTLSNYRSERLRTVTSRSANQGTTFDCLSFHHNLRRLSEPIHLQYIQATQTF